MKKTNPSERSTAGLRPKSPHQCHVDEVRVVGTTEVSTVFNRLDNLFAMVEDLENTAGTLVKRLETVSTYVELPPILLEVKDAPSNDPVLVCRIKELEARVYRVRTLLADNIDCLRL